MTSFSLRLNVTNLFSISKKKKKHFEHRASLKAHPNVFHRQVFQVASKWHPSSASIAEKLNIKRKYFNKRFNLLRLTLGLHVNPFGNHSLPLFVELTSSGIRMARC